MADVVAGAVATSPAPALPLFGSLSALDIYVLAVASAMALIALALWIASNSTDRLALRLFSLRCALAVFGWAFTHPRATDTGPGFPPERAGELFQPFARMHGAGLSRNGIGLTIVRRIVEAHGGRVWAESEPGSGATFRFAVNGIGPPGH